MSDVLTSLALWGVYVEPTIHPHILHHLPARRTEMWMVIIACSVPGCWPLLAHLLRKAKYPTVAEEPNARFMVLKALKLFPLHNLARAYHIPALKGINHTASREASLVRVGIRTPKDVSVQQEVEREVSTPGPRRKSSAAESDMRGAISLAERVLMSLIRPTSRGASA